jgi:hypothetical protein
MFMDLSLVAVRYVYDILREREREREEATDRKPKLKSRNVRLLQENAFDII